MIPEDFLCKPCSLRFTNESVFQIHLSVVHDKIDSNINEKPKLLVVSLAEVDCEKFKCFKCYSNFALKNHLLVHSNLVHKESISNKYPEQDELKVKTTEDTTLEENVHDLNVQESIIQEP